MTFISFNLSLTRPKRSALLSRNEIRNDLLTDQRKYPVFRLPDLRPIKETIVQTSETFISLKLIIPICQRSKILNKKKSDHFVVALSNIIYLLNYIGTTMGSASANHPRCYSSCCRVCNLNLLHF